MGIHNKFLSFAQKIGKNIGRLIEITAALFTILSLIGLGSTIFGFFSKYYIVSIFGIIIIIISIFLFSIVYSLLDEKNKELSVAASQVPPKNSEIHNITILSKEITYEYFEDHPISLIKQYEIVATKDGVRYFPDRYLWTGSGSCTVMSLTSGVSLVNHRREEYWNFFDVFFDQLLENDKLKFALKWDLYDEKETALPFLSASVDIPMKFLSMRVKLDQPPESAFFYKFDNYIDNLPVSRETLSWDVSTNSIYKEIVDPEINQKYLIKWYYTNK